MWDLNGKKHTCAWTFENSSGRAAWLVHSWLTPRWGLCPSFLVVATTLQQFPLALAVTTTSKSTTFPPLPTESYHATSSVVTLDVLVGLCGGGGQTLCPCWDLPLFFDVVVRLSFTGSLLSLCGLWGCRDTWVNTTKTAGEGQECVVATGLGRRPLVHHSLKCLWNCGFTVSASAWSIFLFGAKYLVSVHQQRCLIQLSKLVRCM